MNIKKFFVLIYSVLVVSGVFAQEKNQLSGYIKDGDNGETMIGAQIYLSDNPQFGTVTNTYGYYSLSLEPGTYDFTVKVLGYQDEAFTVDLTEDVKKNVSMTSGVQLKAVTIKAKDKDENIEETQMGRIALPIDQIKKIPALLGETDVLKAIQLLPGVSSTGEGSSGFNVRGGSLDQNLVLLDEAVVYNSGHLFGFFSVFNADAIKNTNLYKGGMPAEYGGRLSSVLDVQMRDGNNQYTEVQGGIGIISSRLTVEGPIKKDKASFIVSGRRTYLFDIISGALKNTDFAGTNYFFYDFNTKLNYKISDKDRLYLSGYFGRDVLDFNIKDRDLNFKLPYGNATATLRWNHVFSDRLFSNTSLIYNDYNFKFTGAQDDFTFTLASGIRDYNLKYDLDYFFSNKHTITAGVNYTYHKITPNILEAADSTTNFESPLEPAYAHEYALYLGDEYKVNERLSIQGGLRFSGFTQLGPYDSPLNGQRYEKGDVVKTYTGLEPRVTARYLLNKKMSVKASFNQNYQYLHLVSNSTSSLPADIWVGSTQIVRPQFGTQYALGLFRNDNEKGLEFSVEGYYRDMLDQLDYNDSYVDNASEPVELSFVNGEGRAYGVEFLLRKNTGRLTGWLGYTYAKTERWFDGIEQGRKYPTIFDRRHDISIVSNYKLSKKIELNGVFVFGSGRPYTPISGVYVIDNKIRFNYAPRNSTRLEAYHRIDLAVNYTPKPDQNKKFSSSWTFAVYNIYNRKNTLFLSTDINTLGDAGGTEISASKFSIFPIIPSVTWNFKWRSKKEDI